MADQPERWKAVGEAIAARMAQLRLTKAELIRRSGVSDKSLAAYLDGAPIRRPDKAWALAGALQWTSDSIDRILAGLDPVTLEAMERVLAAERNVMDRELEVERVHAADVDEVSAVVLVQAEADLLEARLQLRAAQRRAFGDDEGFDDAVTVAQSGPRADDGRIEERLQRLEDTVAHLVEHLGLAVDDGTEAATLQSLPMAADTKGAFTADARRAAVKAARRSRPGRPSPPPEDELLEDATLEAFKQLDAEAARRSDRPARGSRPGSGRGGRGGE